MLVSEKHQKVVLNLSDPSRVLDLIPTAKPFKYKGRELVAVPHKLEETRVLNNMGIKAPGPAARYYKFSGNITPFDSQRTTVDFLTLHPRAFCLNSMGTGKTLSALWAYDYLKQCGLVRKALIITPLSTLERTWGDEIFKHFMHLNFAVVYGNRERRKNLLKEDVDIFLINHDGIKTVLDDLMLMDDIDLVIIDEIATFRNGGTARFKMMKRLVKDKQYIWGLTGTPTPNAPSDAWAQCMLVNPQTVPPYFGRFRDMVMNKYGQFAWVARPDALETVFEAMQPSIRFTLADCVDLPEMTYQTLHAELTKEQARAYKHMVNLLRAEHQGGEILAVNEAVKMSKLLQIAAGVAYSPEGAYIYIPNKPRMDVLKEVIEESEHSVIVYIPLTGALERVAAELRKEWTVEVVHGSTAKGARDRIFGEFQNTPDKKVLVAHPGCMAHGLTMTEATTIVWYLPTTSNETYEQANARIRRPGQTRTTVIVHIEGTDVERRVYSKLQKKGKMQGVLLDMLSDQ